MKGARAYLAIAAVVAALVPAGQSGAQPGGTIQAGFDLFETDPAQTVFIFQGQTAIPPNFFDQGSQAFQGNVEFGGAPLINFQGHDVGDADTVVHRAAGAVPPGGAPSQPINIELVQLSLQSMAPIAVNVNGQPQLWDVEATVSPSRPSTGQMVISETVDGGGTFDSRLTVYPKFTFTRLSDGTTRTLDVGALPDGSRPETTLFAAQTPWRLGCVYPALAVPGLNDGFCPSLTPAGAKMLTVEQAQQARHGIRPVQRRLEHFQCYSFTNLGKFKSRKVKLQDQFGGRTATIRSPGRFCNPVNKSSEGLVNKDDHLLCYATNGPDVKRRVLLRNQFGPFSGVVHRPIRLCLPSTKQLPRKPPPANKAFQTDHFQCYRLEPGGNFNRTPVQLRDQFGKGHMVIFKPSVLCAPVSKNGGPVDHPVRHLVCYERVDKAQALGRKLTARNQFGKTRLRTRKRLELCVPTNKVPF
jgi:hypothetical protein